MVPVIELRGAIPIGIGLGLDYYTAIIFSLIGNILPVPFIILFFRRFFEWLAEKSKIFGRIWKALRDRTMRKAEIVDKYGFWGLCILVAIPLPGTGAWTGAMVACVLDIQMKKSFPAIAVGVVIAAVIVSALSWIGFDVIA
ncbi:MAG: small multi-drug export protein [Clostridia bacterium]|nr:small multi-drug export protein [Clostridia bacterium]